MKNFLKKVTKKIKDFDEIDNEIVERAFRFAIGSIVKSRFIPEESKFEVSCGIGITFIIDVRKNFNKLLYYYEKPPRNNDEIKQFIKDMDPKKVALSGSVGVKLFIDLSVKITNVYGTKYLLDNFERAIKSLKQ